MRIGLDFDNTLAGYDTLFARLAAEAGWLESGFSGGKKELRDRVRLLPDGEQRWMVLQARAYGPRMAEARLIDGVAPFLRACRRRGHGLVIVSHKTRFAAADPQGSDLRQAALDWMAAQGFFAADGFALARADVHFTDSRADKCARIGALGCTLFIDDLEEVFLDPAFPPRTGRFLFHPGGQPPPAGPFRAFSDWATLSEAVLAHG
jgi:hypothetical protein